MPLPIRHLCSSGDKAAMEEMVERRSRSRSIVAERSQQQQQTSMRRLTGRRSVSRWNEDPFEIPSTSMRVREEPAPKSPPVREESPPESAVQKEKSSENKAKPGEEITNVWASFNETQKQLYGRGRMPTVVQAFNGQRIAVYYGHQCYFSHYHPCLIYLAGKYWICAEQYYLHEKLMHFGKAELACELAQVTAELTGKEGHSELHLPWPVKELQLLAKEAGKDATHEQCAEWDGKRLLVMWDIQSAKFQQNKQLQAALLATGEMELISASFNKFWGNGLGLSREPEKRQHELLQHADMVEWRFRGCRNMAGNILMKIRKELRWRDKIRPPDWMQELDFRTALLKSNDHPPLQQQEQQRPALQRNSDANKEDERREVEEAEERRERLQMQEEFSALHRRHSGYMKGDERVHVPMPRELAHAKGISATIQSENRALDRSPSSNASSDDQSPMEPPRSYYDDDSQHQRRLLGSVRASRDRDPQNGYDGNIVSTTRSTQPAAPAKRKEVTWNVGEVASARMQYRDTLEDVEWESDAEVDDGLVLDSRGRLIHRSTGVVLEADRYTLLRDSDVPQRGVGGTRKRMDQQQQPRAHKSDTISDPIDAASKRGDSSYLGCAVVDKTWLMSELRHCPNIADKSIGNTSPRENNFAVPSMPRSRGSLQSARARREEEEAGVSQMVMEESERIEVRRPLTRRMVNVPVVEEESTYSSFSNGPKIGSLRRIGMRVK